MIHLVFFTVCIVLAISRNSLAFHCAS